MLLYYISCGSTCRWKLYMKPEFSSLSFKLVSHLQPNHVSVHRVLIEWRKGLIKCPAVIFAVICSLHLSCVFVYMPSINRWLWFIFSLSVRAQTHTSCINLHVRAHTHTHWVLSTYLLHVLFWGLVPSALAHFSFFCWLDIFVKNDIYFEASAVILNNHCWSVLLLWRYFRPCCTRINIFTPFCYSVTEMLNSSRSLLTLLVPAESECFTAFIIYYWIVFA